MYERRGHLILPASILPHYTALDIVSHVGAERLFDVVTPSAFEGKDLVGDVRKIIGGGTHAAVVTSGHPQAFNSAADMLRIGGALCCVGIPPGDASLDTPIAAIVIKGVKIMGNLVGSMNETLEAVELVRSGKVKVPVQVRDFQDLPEVYEMLEKGDIPGGD